MLYFRCLFAACIACCVIWIDPAFAQQVEQQEAGPEIEILSKGRIDQPPIEYLKSAGNNPVSRLRDKLREGSVELEYETQQGYVKSLLKQLNIPIDSQVLVFSKTSLQAFRISPSNPRAFYFNDEVVVGWIQGSSLVEIATADPDLGVAFYSMQMGRRPYLSRENNRCLTCHETTTGAGKHPVHMVRSVSTRSSGKINLLLDMHDTDHTSPIEQRWGGWFVTGDAGGMEHMGNSFLEDETMVAFGKDSSETLRSQFDTQRWPSPTSDLIALMVLEHQIGMQNRMIEANYAAKRLVAGYQVAEDGSVSTEDAIDDYATSIVDYMLFADEVPLTAPIKGSNSFTESFQKQGQRAKSGRSLRDLELNTRLFRYPCSYQIYTPQFDALQPQLLAAVYQKLHDVLTGKNASPRYEHLSKQDRESILAILVETKQGLPDYFQQ